MALWLAGKVVLITGAGSGIGRAVAERFINEDAKVVAFDRSEEKLKALMGDFGKDVVAVNGDVTKLEDNERAVAKALEFFDHLDVFVGNAGVFDGFKSLTDLPKDNMGTAFDEVFAVNVKGYLFGAKAAVPELTKTEGNIVFTASTAGFGVGGGGPIYTASKHAVVGLIRQLAYELAPRIRVNGVAPGGTVTDLRSVPSLGARQVFSDRVTAEERGKQNTPLSITLQPEDHVGAYLLLASDQSRAMTGVIINSDGGTAVRGHGRR